MQDLQKNESIDSELKSESVQEQMEDLLMPESVQHMANVPVPELDEQTENCPVPIETPLALLNDMVILELFHLLPVSDVLNCRLVCSQWNDAAIPNLRRRAVVGSKLEDYLTFTCEFKLSTFVTTMEKSSCIPYCNFVLKRIRMSSHSVAKLLRNCVITGLVLDLPENCVSAIQFSELLEERLPHLQVLDLDYLPHEVTSSKMYSLDNQFSLPNLKKIIFPTAGENYSVTFMIYLIKAACNLEIISTNHKAQISPLLEALELQSNLSKLKSLRFVHLNALGFHRLIILSNRGLKLKEFKVESLDQDVTNRSLECFLNSQKNILETMAIGDYDGENNLLITLPLMESLKELCLVPNSTAKVFFINNSFVQQTPCLKSLVVSTYDTTENQYFPPSLIQAPSTSVQELHVALKYNNSKLISNLPKMFPAVKRFKLDFANTSTLRALWTAWPELEELSLYINDSLYSNIDKILIGGRHSRNRIASPGIQTLKKLRILYIDVDSVKQSCVITDLSVQRAFVLMPRLQKITITRCSISPEGRSFLLASLPQLISVDIRTDRVE